MLHARLSNTAYLVQESISEMGPEGLGGRGFRWWEARTWPDHGAGGRVAVLHFGERAVFAEGVRGLWGWLGVRFAGGVFWLRGRTG